MIENCRWHDFPAQYEEQRCHCNIVGSVVEAKSWANNEVDVWFSLDFGQILQSGLSRGDVLKRGLVGAYWGNHRLDLEAECW